MPMSIIEAVKRLSNEIIMILNQSVINKVGMAPLLMQHPRTFRIVS